MIRALLPFWLLLSACAVPAAPPKPEAAAPSDARPPAVLRAIGLLMPSDTWERWVVEQGEHRVVQFELVNRSAEPVEYLSHYEGAAWLDDGHWSPAAPLEELDLPPGAVLSRDRWETPEWHALEPGGRIEFRRAMRAGIRSADVRMVGLRSPAPDGSLLIWSIGCEAADFAELPVSRENLDSWTWDFAGEVPWSYRPPEDEMARVRLLMLDQQPVDPDDPYGVRWCTLEIRNDSPSEFRVLASKSSIWLDRERWHPEYGLWEVVPRIRCGNCMESYESVTIPPGGALQRRIRMGGNGVTRPLLEVPRASLPQIGPWIRCEGPPEPPAEGGVPSPSED